jgi:hypothetical protein
MDHNAAPCKSCKDLHTQGMPAPLSENQTLKRGSSRFYECPDCARLYAVKALASDPHRYVIVSAASANVAHEWLIDAKDGSRQKARSKMTEEEALKKYPTAERIPAASERADAESE